MDKNNYLNTIALITVFVMLLLAFFLLTVKTKNKLSNSLFAVFLFLTAFDLSGFFTYKYFNEYLNFEIFRMTTSLLNMPLFYLYVKSVCHSDFKLKLKNIILTVPFIFSNIIFIPKLYLGTFLERNLFFDHFEQMLEVQFFNIIGELQYAFYIVLIFITIKKYKEIYLENYTNSNNSSYKWLFQMTVFFLIAHCMVFFRFLMKYTNHHALLSWSNVIIGTIALIISCWFVLKALNNPDLFKGIDSNMLLINEVINTELVNKKTILETSKTTAISAQIDLVKKYVTEYEPYLEPTLTIQELSKQVNIPVRDLSVLINHQMNQHFFDFINEYRISKAMQLLKDPLKSKFTVLEILYEVGFNSKSSFNTAFKKYTNQTPTEFRNS